VFFFFFFFYRRSLYANNALAGGWTFPDWPAIFDFNVAKGQLVMLVQDANEYLRIVTLRLETASFIIGEIIDSGSDTFSHLKVPIH
jgi:hypothetical protein